MSQRVRMFSSLLSLLVFSQIADAQDTLVWKFRAQETLQYTVKQTMKTSMDIGGNKINQDMNQSMDMAWNVQSVAASGDVVMSQVVRRIQMNMAGGPAGEVEFDTNNTQKSDNPIVNSMGDVFRKIVNQPFTVSMKPTGEITNVEVPNQLLEAVRQSAAGATGALDENTLKQMMKQSAVTLPGQPVSPKNSWTSTQNVQLPFGTMNIRSTMTYLEKDSAGNALIDVVPEITVTPKEGAPVKMTLKNSSGRGQVTFNIVQGRVAKSQLDLTLTMTIETGGQTFNQTIEQTTAMALAQ